MTLEQALAVAENTKENHDRAVNQWPEQIALMVMADELRRLQEERKWQPIETAPKDGTEVLLFDAKDAPNEYVGFYDEGGYWCYSELLVQDVTGAAYPTHWMPKPENPQ